MSKYAREEHYKTIVLRENKRKNKKEVVI